MMSDLNKKKDCLEIKWLRTKSQIIQSLFEQASGTFSAFSSKDFFVTYCGVGREGKGGDGKANRDGVDRNQQGVDSPVCLICILENHDVS